MRKHPAKYTNILMPHFYELVKDCKNVLDPFAGTGKIGLLKELGYSGEIYCNEIEREWIENSPYNFTAYRVGDAAKMDWCEDGFFECICTSPTYGNRMADHYNYKDTSERFTYKKMLGRDLNEANTGRMNWGEKYRTKHKECYIEFKRVLHPDAKLIINMSNHIRKGEEINVVSFHIELLKELGFEFIEEIKVPTPRLKVGANSKQRVETESILVFKNKK